ncbi:hypothetical protein LPJ61_001699, partial [Coemansia biformis]
PTALAPEVFVQDGNNVAGDDVGLKDRIQATPTHAELLEPSDEYTTMPSSPQAEAAIDDLTTEFEQLEIMTIDAQGTGDDDILHVVILHPNATLPKSAHEDDAGYDVMTPNTSRSQEL